MNYAQMKFNQSLMEQFNGQKLSKNYKEEINAELLSSNFFEKNLYVVLKLLESNNTFITGVPDYNEFKTICILNSLPNINHDMLFALSQDNMLGIIDNELKLDVDEVKSALLVKQFGDESKQIFGMEIDKLNHITRIYDLDNNGEINENEFKLNDLKIGYETGQLVEVSEPYQRKVEIHELGL